MGKMTIFAFLIVLLGYTGCALMKGDDDRKPRIGGMELEEEVEMMDSIDDDEFADDPYADAEDEDDDEDEEPEPEPEEEDNVSDSEEDESDSLMEPSEHSTAMDDEPYPEPEYKPEPIEEDDAPLPAEATIEVVPQSVGRMARLKRDCNMRAMPTEKSRSLRIQKDIGTRIWVEPENQRFYRVLRRDSSQAYMWKHCFIQED